MSTILSSVETFLEAAGITDSKGNTLTVFKGLDTLSDEPLPSKYKHPYVNIMDGGERTEKNEGIETQYRYYQVRLEMVVMDRTIEKANDMVLDLYNDVKTEFEKEENRLGDGFVFGVTVEPFMDTGPGGNEKLYHRGRYVIVEYYELEDTYFNY